MRWATDHASRARPGRSQAGLAFDDTNPVATPRTNRTERKPRPWPALLRHVEHPVHPRVQGARVLDRAGLGRRVRVGAALAEGVGLELGRAAGGDDVVLDVVLVDPGD